MSKWTPSQKAPGNGCGCIITGLLIGMMPIILGVGLGYLIHVLKPTPPAKPEPRGNVEVLAVTESGTTVYRVDGPRAIVPVVWVESKEGHVSIR